MTDQQEATQYFATMAVKGRVDGKVRVMWGFWIFNRLRCLPFCSSPLTVKTPEIRFA
jgi:hypothetical protein